LQRIKTNSTNQTVKIFGMERNKKRGELQNAWYRNAATHASLLLFLLMAVFSQAFFTLVGCHFVPFSFLSAGHNSID